MQEIVFTWPVITFIMKAFNDFINFAKLKSYSFDTQQSALPSCFGERFQNYFQILIQHRTILGRPERECTVFAISQKENLLAMLRLPLWSRGHSSSLQIQRSRVRFPTLQDYLRSGGSGTGSTQPREDN
jgi:hypothetical protein